MEDVYAYQTKDQKEFIPPASDYYTPFQPAVKDSARFAATYVKSKPA
jgi:hypothetical protein